MNYKLNKVSRLLLNAGLGFVTGCYFVVMMYIRDHLDVIGTIEAGIMLEHVTMTLFIIVAAALLFDIHIKWNKKDKK